MTDTKTVAVIEGDDAAPEAVRPTIELLRHMDLPMEFTYPTVGEAPVELSNLGISGKTIRKPVADLAPGRYAIKAITEAGSERVIRFAYELARQRSGRLTITSKYNMLPETDGLFLKIGQDLAAEYPDVELNHYIVDDFACRMVTTPQHFDVVVMPNLYGDILSDAAAGLVGGLGMAASGCYGNHYAYFESAHGTAPDIAGQNTINPTANLLSAAMMLSYLDFADAAARLIYAVATVYQQGRTLTPDQGGKATTGEFCSAVQARLHS